jgi:hypothetical protein
VASLTDKHKQRNPKHPGGHRSKKAHENKDTGRPAKAKPGLAKVKTGGSIYVQMPKVMKAITISDDSESDEKQEQESKQQPKDKQLVVETDEDEDNKDEDDKNDKNDDKENQEDDYMPYISRETVDGYLVRIIGHLEEYT